MHIICLYVYIQASQPIAFDSFELLRVIGRGSFGKVSKDDIFHIYYGRNDHLGEGWTFDQKWKLIPNTLHICGGGRIGLCGA